MKSIREIKAFTDELEIVEMPDVRIIGREVRNGGALGNTAPQMWDSVYGSQDHVIMEALPQVVSQDMFGWTCDYDPKDDTFSYIVCAMTPSGTPVPGGFWYRDIPAATCALGIFGESVEKTLERAGEMGYVNDWNAPGHGWNAEAYFHEEELKPPKAVGTPWHWLVPVSRREQ